ncbi:class I SAM-dependent methyltransferase [Arthrobacter woluwensis]|uniref:class I SAM-dependent methyltransferase n=1 Tax=Arthrobacter woluwensis TaxID=156980 RepID=UPI0011A2B571|nr:class I SAM-dependent methyltransferase [Arthrobacter woluwensis]
MNAKDKEFVGSIPTVYDEVLVPLMFQDFACDLAATVAAAAPARVLETAAGTGVVTRELASALPQALLTATDLNPAMLARAASLQPASATLEWRQADALSLPFDDRSFDALACAFGVMFFPDRHRAFQEVARVLRPGGLFAFTVWDSLEHNPVPRSIVESLHELGQEEAASFLERVPFSLADPPLLTGELEAAGFSSVQVRTIEHLSGPTTGAGIARSHLFGTPTNNYLVLDGPEDADRLFGSVTSLLVERFGDGEFRLPVSALLVTALSPSLEQES